jgi:hypothetical protein
MSAADEHVPTDAAVIVLSYSAGASRHDSDARTITRARFLFYAVIVKVSDCV